MDAGRFNSAYRLGIAIALVYVLCALVPNLLSYTDLVVATTRGSRNTMAAQQQKLSAANLESSLAQAKPFGPNAQLRCRPADGGGWDYVCSYLPTPLQSQTRLQFGVAVDAKRWVKVSRVVPMGTVVPPAE